MKIGLILPQGYFNEFDGWTPTTAWERTMEVAQLAHQLGFESLWSGEHVLAKWDPEGIDFDCVTQLTAIAAAIPDVELGFTVINSTFRNPAMTAKTAATLDTISRGRLILGLGAGFKENEAKAFGQPYPDLKERMAILAEHFEIVSRMTRRDEPPFTFIGEHARVEDVVNNPRTSGRDHIPLLIGGHGPNVTFRLAARYCDEINIDVDLADMPASIAVLHDRCAEIGRDPSTLMVSSGTNPAWPYPGLKVTGKQRMMTPADLPAILKADFSKLGTRAEELAGWRELGIGRMTCGVPGLVDTDEGLYELIDDCRAAGIEIAPRAGVAA
jgi:alkanesulfonate monooxygenase SsuD/methylene tetrahydromethanopterin reductase-like flavin-dependent oxidoreductase (luciferase family)